MGGPVRRSRPPADERQVRRRDDVELERPRPPRRRRVQRFGRDLVARREGDHAEPPAELAGEDLQHRHADERGTPEHQRGRTGGHDVGQSLVRLHEGDRRVVPDDLHVAVVGGPEPAGERRQPIRIPLRRAPHAGGAVAVQGQPKHHQSHARERHRVVDDVQAKQAGAPGRRVPATGAVPQPPQLCRLHQAITETFPALPGDMPGRRGAPGRRPRAAPPWSPRERRRARG